MIIFKSLNKIYAYTHDSCFNFRCVKARQCGNPILPNPSRPEDQVFTPDLAVYDGKFSKLYFSTNVEGKIIKLFQIPFL